MVAATPVRTTATAQAMLGWRVVATSSIDAVPMAVPSWAAVLSTPAAVPLIALGTVVPKSVAEKPTRCRSRGRRPGCGAHDDRVRQPTRRPGDSPTDTMEPADEGSAGER